MDLHQLPGLLYSSLQLYSVTARGLDRDPSSCSADDKMIEKLKIDWKYTHLSLSSTWALASNYLPKGSFYLFMLSDFLCSCFRNGRFEIAIVGFFSDWNFAICKGWQIKTIIAYTWPCVIASVYRSVWAIQWQHWVGTRWLWSKKMQWQLQGGFIYSNCSNPNPESFLLILENIISSILFCFVTVLYMAKIE